MGSLLLTQVNVWAAAWASWMGASLLGATVVLLVVTLLWWAIRRKAAPQLGYLLFLLVPLKLFVPLEIAVPERFVAWLPYRTAESVVSVSTSPLASPSHESLPTSVLAESRTSASESVAAQPSGAADALRSTSLAQATPAPTWQAGLMSVWILGVLGLFVRLVQSQIRFSRLARSATPLEPARLGVAWESLCARIGVSRPVRLMESEQLTAPVVWGIRRPTLILPTGLVTSLSTEQLEWVLLHELGHVRRRDLAVHAWQRLVTILQFPNPAIWAANRTIGRLREYACDDLATAVGQGEPCDAGQAFLGVLRFASAKSTGQTPTLAGSLGMFESTARTACQARLVRLLDSERRTPVRLGLGSLAFLLVVAALALPQLRAASEPETPAAKESTPAVTSGKKAEAPADKDVYHFSVIIAQHVMLLEGKEIVTWADIEKEIASQPNPSQTHPDFHFTSGAIDAGLFEPVKKEAMRLHSKYKLVGHGIGSLGDDGLRYDLIRTAADLKPEPLRVNGTVVDAVGKPVAGAEVWLPLRGRDSGRVRTLHAKSDALGQFALEVPTDWLAQMQPWDRTATAWAYADGHQLGTGRVVLPDDVSDVSIRLGPTTETSFVVLDPEGRPCPGALVEPFYIRTWLAIQFPPDELLTLVAAHTDAEGRVKLPAIASDLLYQVRVTTKDFGIQFQRTIQAPGRAIHLRPVGKIEGRVTASQPESIRGMRLILTSQEQQAGPGQSPTNESPTEGFAEITPDAQGRFVVAAIAVGDVRIDAVVDDQQPLRPKLPTSLRVQANQTTTLEIPMVPTVVARGSVRVQGTARPVAGVLVYIYYGVGRQGAEAVTDAQGQYTAPVLPGGIRLQVIATPKGYTWLHKGTPSYQVPEDAKEFELPPVDVALTKSISGRVVDQQDQPVDNIWISVVEGDQHYGRAKSDKNGQFEMTDVPVTIDPMKVKYVWLPEVGPGRPFVSTMPSQCEVLKTNPLILRALPRDPRMDQKTDGHSEGGLNSGDDRRDDQLRTAAEVPPPAPADEVYHFSVVVARHVLLLEGKEIVTWADIEKKIASRPKPSQTHPDFYITRGAMEAGLYEPSKKEIWRLHGDYKLVGHSEGSLLPRADWHYDQIRTAADLKPDESLRIEGTVVTADGKPVAGAEVVLVSPVDASISYKPYDIYLVRGRLRNPLDEVMTHSDQEGRFAIYPPRDTPYAVLALHPVVGFGLTDRKQFTGEGKVRLLAWAGLESQFSQEPERQEASLRTRIAALGERPEIVLSQYWSDLKRPEPTLHFHFTQVPPIFETAISRDFPSPDGGLQGVSGASVSLLPGETRRVDLGPVTEQQRKFMEEMRHR